MQQYDILMMKDGKKTLSRFVAFRHVFFNPAGVSIL
jgi:hypothetical protein